MKNIRLYVLLAMLTVILTACFEGNDYKSEKNQFTVSYPAGWEKQSGVLGTEVMFLAPKQSKEDKMQENISVFSESNKFTLDQYRGLVIDQTKKIVTDYSNEKVEKIKVAGEDGYQIVYNENMLGTKLKTARYVFKHNDKFFVLTYAAEESQFETYTKEVKDTIESFKFTK